MDSNTEANVFSTVIELPTSELGAKPEIRIWGRCSVRKDGKLIHADRAGHPSVSSFFNTDDTKLEYNASEPVNDRKRWTDQFVHLMGHTGHYTRDEAIAAIDADRILPDMLCFDPSKPAKYPNGRSFTDDVIDHRLAFLSKGEIPPSGLEAAHRHSQGVPVHRYTASEEELAARSRSRDERVDLRDREAEPGEHLARVLAGGAAVRG